ncbi:MAG: hypothetical protein JO269_03195 [Burkholderiaceae bacterium]|nr:hypothetical protein [Burkholderiaceae bacterium]
MNRMKDIAAWCSLAAAALLAGCGGGGSDASISGAVSGLGAGLSVVLVNNGGDAQTISANGNFSFDGKIAPNSGYNVTVKTQPTGQTCLVTSGSGVIDFSGASVGNVAVTCYNNVTVGGTVTGLNAGGVVLQDNFNSADTVTVSANGGAGVNFTFPLKHALGDSYNVTVLTQPSSQVCTVTQGQGGITAWSNITGVSVTCQ